MASGLTSQLRWPAARLPAQAARHIPASSELTRWEAAEVVLRLHVRQRKLRFYPSVPLDKRCLQLPNIVVAPKPSPWRLPLEFGDY
jgi:hypothetical protein